MTPSAWAGLACVSAAFVVLNGLCLVVATTEATRWVNAVAVVVNVVALGLDLSQVSHAA